MLTAEKGRMMRPLIFLRSEMAGLSVVANKAEDPGAPEGLGFGPEDLRKIRAWKFANAELAYRCRRSAIMGHIGV